GGVQQGAPSPMTRDDFNTYCAAKRGSTHVIQWGNSDVWKIGGKVYALCGWNDGGDAFTFKVSEMIYEVMQDAPGFRPAPYLASRGMTWLQIYEPSKVLDAEIHQHIDASFDLVAAKLTRKVRRALGLETE
ncbi:MAG: MmcQ/YjbR family DNA-binding protein, partial [Pseudomonadota bacterium]